MGISPGAEIAALLLTIGVHLIGGAVLIWAMIDHDSERPSWRDWWPRDDDGRTPPPTTPDPVPSGGGLDIPLLPDAQPSPVRLREPGRIGDSKQRPSRRPAHPAQPDREPSRR